MILDGIHAKGFSAKILYTINVDEKECALVCGWLRIPRTMSFASKVSIRHTYLNKCLAHTTQWMGSDGVFLMVHPGKVFCGGLGWHS